MAANAEHLVSQESTANTRFIAQMRLQSGGGPGVEPETAAMYQAVLGEYNRELNELISDPDAKTPVANFLYDVADQTLVRRKIHSAPALSLLRTALVYYFQKRTIEVGPARNVEGKKEFSDKGRVTPEAWEGPIELLRDGLSIVDEETPPDQRSKAVTELHENIANRSAVGAVKGRIVPIDLMSQLVADRFPDGATALDNGTCLMVGPLFMLHKAQFPHDFGFKKVTFFEQGKKHPRGMTDKANLLVSRPPVISKVIGTDVLQYYYEEEGKKIYDRGTAEFALASLRPSERNNPAHIGTVKALMDKKERGSYSYTEDSGVTFRFTNLLDPRELGEFKDAYPEPFQFIIMSYVMQELSQADQARMHDIANDLLADNGMLLYLHQAYLTSAQPGHPVDWSTVTHYSKYATEPWCSSLQFVDRLNPHNPHGLQEAMIFHDNRCDQARVKLGQLVVNGELVPIADLIKNTALAHTTD